MKRIFSAVLICLCVVLGACSVRCDHDFMRFVCDELSENGRQQYRLICKTCGYETYEEILDTESTSNVVESKKDDTPEHIQVIFDRFLEWQDNYPSENIRLQGPLTLENNYWTFNVKILADSMGGSKSVRFHVPENESAEYSFNAYFEEDEKAALRDYVKAMIYAISPGLDVQECLSISDSLINSYGAGLSAVFEVGKYKIFIAESNTVYKYRVEAVYKDEQNPKVDMTLFEEIDYDRLRQGRSELSEAAVLFKFKGTVLEYSVSDPFYPLVVIRAVDDLANEYEILTIYTRTLDDIVVGEQFVFFASLSTESGAPVECSLCYFEAVN